MNWAGKAAEGPVHRVKLTSTFYMGKYEVTQKQWYEIIGINPSRFSGDNQPVEQVSWYEVQEFIKKLNEKEGSNKYRLPSEAEWEYSTRAGTKTSYSFGDDESRLGEYAWISDNSNKKTHAVGQKKPNQWGLYDMHGNVREWVQDIHQFSYDGAPSNGSVWEGTGFSRGRVSRDCSRGWSSGRNCRSAYRSYTAAAERQHTLGFRLMRIL